MTIKLSTITYQLTIGLLFSFLTVYYMLNLGVKSQMSKEEMPGGILVADTADKIQEDYFSVNQTHSTFLPPERKLTDQYNVSRSTMRRALSLLTHRNLIRAEHGRGYRILASENALNKTPRIAILQATEKSAIHSGRTAQEIIDAMQRQSLKRKWQVLNIDVGELNPKIVVSELKDANIQAVAMVFEDQKIAEALVKEGIPCISLENSGRELNLDYIFQDNYGGARKAASYLLSKGHQRIAWVGPVKESYTSFARWSGANSAFLDKEFELAGEDTITESHALENAVRNLLSQNDRPKAILALWERHLVTVIQMAKELKIKIGKDIDVVGWSNEARYQVLINELLPKKSIPPMVVWSPDEMAEVAINRLLLHWQDSSLSPLHIAIPAKLVLPKK